VGCPNGRVEVVPPSMRLFAFAILLIILFAFAAAIATVVYHLKKYSVPGDKTRGLLQIFIVGTVIFVLATLLLFLSIPWDQFSPPPSLL